MKIKIDHLLISICSAILIGYLLILFKVICLKYLSISDLVSHLEMMKHHRPYNLVPFATIKFYVFSDSMPMLRRAGNIFGNIALFVPIGIFLPAVFRFTRKILPLLAISVLLSSILELFQYTLGTGSADIDDVILNTLGGLSGYAIFLILKTRLKSETKTMAASLILFVILFITGGWFAILEFKPDLGLMTGSAH
jgi:glycopeptide antibiotics resistance protein